MNKFNKIYKRIMCFICLENDNTEEKLKCGHNFHTECLKNLIYPYCPLCRADITYFIEKFKTKKQIKNGIEIEKYRVMITSINNYYTELDKTQLHAIITRIRKLNKIKAYDNYFKIIKSIIECNGKKFQRLFNRNNDEYKNEGIFIYFCETNLFIQNILNGYKHAIIKWLNKSDFETFKPITANAKGLFKKTQFNTNSFPVLIVLKDNSKYYIEPIIIENKNTLSIPSTNSIIKFLCEDQPFVNIYESITPDSEYISYLLKNEKINSVCYKTIYEFFESFLTINSVIKDGMIEVIFQNKNSNVKIFDYVYTFKKTKNNIIKYCYNKKKISIKKMGYYIQKIMNTQYDLFIRIHYFNNDLMPKTTLKTILCCNTENLMYEFTILSKYGQYEIYDINNENFMTEPHLHYEYI